MVSTATTWHQNSRFSIWFPLVICAWVVAPKGRGRKGLYHLSYALVGGAKGAGGIGWKGLFDAHTQTFYLSPSYLHFCDVLKSKFKIFCQCSKLHTILKQSANTRAQFTVLCQNCIMGVPKKCDHRFVAVCGENETASISYSHTGHPNMSCSQTLYHNLPRRKIPN
jgi:hypothetical protein